MRKYAYICLMLPALTLGSAFADVTSSHAKANNMIQLKSATMVDVDKEICGDNFHRGACYIFDESDPALVLKNLKYKINSENELVVDLHFNKEEQTNLHKLSNKFAGKKNFVFLVNDQVVSTSFLKQGPKDKNVHFSSNNKGDLEFLLSALSNK